MINSLFPLALLFGLGIQQVFPSMVPHVAWLTQIALVLLLLVIGLQMGMSMVAITSFRAVLRIVVRIVCVTLIGTISASILFAVLTSTPIIRSLAIGMGMGFYSVSSTMLLAIHQPDIAAFSFIANVLRESLGLACTPLIVRLAGRYAPITVIASASDSGAAIISRSSGPEVTIICIVSAFILSWIVPLALQLCSTWL